MNLDGSFDIFFCLTGKPDHEAYLGSNFRPLCKADVSDDFPAGDIFSQKRQYPVSSAFAAKLVFL